MSEREAGRFRGNLFGGFNRKDVLAYITSVYEELDYAQAENDMLRQRCDELEALLDQGSAAGAHPMDMPMSQPMDSMPEPMWDPAMQTGQVPFGPDRDTPVRPEDLHPMAPPVQEPEPAPVPPVHEAPRVKPNLANPYPERGRKVKVRPARES